MFFPTDDRPHFNDHDFPVPGYLIEPDGFLLLQSKEKNVKLTKDKLDRELLKYHQLDLCGSITAA